MYEIIYLIINILKQMQHIEIISTYLFKTLKSWIKIYLKEHEDSEPP